MQQSKALSLLKSGVNIFLTGSAGSGKTYVLNQYIKYLKARKIAVAVTASTGIASTHMNGMTIHSWAGIGIKQALTPKDLKTLSARKYMKDKLEAVQVLIIDEISMLHKQQLDLVDTVLKHFKNNMLPFGGIQVVFAGDFFQLPPIGNHGELSRDKFAFMSDAWLQASINICYLTEQFRQQNNSLTQILNEIRADSVSLSSIHLLENAKTQNSPKDVTKLFTHNADVDQINTQELAKLPGKSMLFNATTKGNEKLVDMLKNTVLASEVFKLKVNAKVMFVRNNPEKNVVNGSLGIVEKFTEEDQPIIRLLTGEKVKVEPETWSVNDEKGKALAEFTQIPLRLAWAITIHKSQGMTLDAAQIDLSKTFERGQGYVALSRLKDISSLSLLGFNETALQVDQLAKKADVRFQELSQLIEQGMNEEELEKKHTAFIKKCGGISDKKELEKYANKQKDKQNTKMATHEKTALLVQNGCSLSEIAEKRGLGESTILNHVVKISELMPEVNISSCKPNEHVINIVSQAFKQLQEELASGKSTGPGLKNIFSKLNGEIDYNSIKLALIFMNA
ncbi:MAG: ATP-dependent exoDNAse (exonuclease V) alpha subunit [Flavobacteriales bacterium]|jgi:ATP-dependent exoDNAse (exonuclease V) alpha subunit